MNNFDVVKKLVGPINPVGETHTDTKRHENLKQLVELSADILFELKDTVVDCEHCMEHSVKESGLIAKKHIRTMMDEMAELFEEDE